MSQTLSRKDQNMYQSRVYHSKNQSQLHLESRGKTQRSLPRVKLPDSFSLSANEKHFSNKQEPLKLIDEIITPYVQKGPSMYFQGK